MGDWVESPLGAFTDVMVATAQGRRILLAPDEAVAQYVSATYTFDEVRLCPVTLVDAPDGWRLAAGPLSCQIGIGHRTSLGWLLRPVPERVGGSRAFARLCDPVARRLLPGVRTVGSAGGGRDSLEHRDSSRPARPTSTGVTTEVVPEPADAESNEVSR